MKNFSLDDKKLLEVFGNGDKNKLFFKGNSEIAKKFILFLLKMRILFDYFIFKRSVKSTTGEEDIKLRKIKIKNDKYELGELDRELINLQLLFSFTSPNYLQQEWLTPTLGYLYENLKNGFNEDIYNELKTFLENLDRNLAIERLKDNPDLKKVFDKTLEEPNHQNTLSNSKEKDNKQIKNELNENLNENLNRGTATEHYWFYKLEYLLWKNSKDKFNQIKPPFKNFDYSNIKEKYRLTRKNSIEHIHPQSKTNENEWTQNNNENNCEKKCHIDCFGNLALISSHLNSKLIDKSFENKKVYIQEQLNNGTIESLKMLLVYSKYEKWTHVECEEHHNEMIELLLNSLSAQKNNA
ncbi:MAG: hypothetical protein KatS3mg034_0668 [Vicingaceae bacterium]|nr:MAG: hypothetical protein KatS3mg034_0664 [Vicingaceae bacterium]GIV41358.1 MAG: hypothetical protein KatS3mg034_0668 [Vicingaceae bacterium]